MDGPHPPRVHSAPEVLGGTPVFVGSRLPVVTLLACVDAREPWARLVESWPWLTEAHVAAARAWVAEHPHNQIRPWLR
jgi:uncharacterized protein (DUF433 family)